MSEYENNSYRDQAPQPKKKKHTAWKIVLIVVLCLLIGFPAFYGAKTLINKYTPAYSVGGVGGLAGAIGNDVSGNKNANTEDTTEAAEAAETPAESVAPVATAKPAATPKTNTSATTTELTEEEIYENNVDSVVSISTTLEGYNYFGQKVQGAAAGSGFIVTSDGYILTNYHVIEGSTSITVTTYDGTQYPATVRGYDSSNDIAILKVDAKDLKSVTFGDSDELKPGQHVVAIGNALGQYGFSITQGIISGLARDVQVDTDLTMSLIQTDCTINSGNSGGPLFNMNGEVIGITNAKLSSSLSSSSAAIENIGFAIPINSVSEIVADIIANGGTTTIEDKTPFLGIQGSDVSEETIAVTGIPGGALVASVYEGSAAAEAGIQPNDIIIGINGKEVTSFTDLKEEVAALKVGDTAVFTVYRSGSVITVNATLTAKSDVNTDVDTEASTTTPTPNEAQPQQTPSNGSNSYNDYGSLYDFFNRYYGQAN